MATLARTTATSEVRGFQRFWRALKQLFHEAVAALFAVLALSWLSAALRAWSRDVAHWLLTLPVGVAVIFAYFAITSYQRARRI